MSDVNKMGERQNSASIMHARSIRRPRRFGIIENDTKFVPFTLAQRQASEDDADAALLNTLHQELKGINEGMGRINKALFELVEEMKALHKTHSEDFTA